jgi:diguanylate cyclase (GGDEF)-like protein
MDVFTAGTTLIMVQLCVALVMAAIFHVTPAEKCTRYWAMSGTLIATGVLIVVLNAGAPRFMPLIIGYGLVIFGIACQGAGIRAFYRKPQGYASWLVCAVFFVLFAALVLHDPTVRERSALASSGVLVMLTLNFLELVTGRGQPRSFARALALGAMALLISGYGTRVYLSIAHGMQIVRPGPNPAIVVVLAYMLPLVGTLLLSNGLLLMYFERVVADKHHLATHDELSGVLNRRAVIANGERELQLATRLKLPVAVAFVDIDRFKSINDTLGHDAGDKVIAETAQVLKQSCRSIDLVGRYGGEEFCLIFPGIGGSEAELIGARLADTVRQHQFSIGQSVTVSVGIATMEKNTQDRSLAQLIRRADTALYEAKDSGRDRYAIAA